MKYHKYGIKTINVSLKTNINGKVIERRDKYVVYRKYLFGLVHRYLFLMPSLNWMAPGDVHVAFRCHCSQATSFKKRSEAELLIRKIREIPDKFLLLKGLK